MSRPFRSTLSAVDVLRFGRTLLVLALCLGLVGWSVSFGTLPPADLSFGNGTEIKTVDPALVSGAPEGRVVTALFEGLTAWDPQDLHPVPGVAERWTISPDGATYTFFLRENARWSDGSPVTTDDFVFAFQRLLDPQNLSEYSYQLWMVRNAKRYTTAELAPGDPVEIEFDDRPEGARPFARGRLIHRKLVRVDGSGADRVYTVMHGAVVERYSANPAPGSDVERCRRVLLDFGSVGILAPGPRELRLVLERPTPYFLRLTGFYPLFPVNRKCVETYGYPHWTKPEHIVTNGPFHLQWRRIRDRIRLVKSPTYWDRDHVRLNTVDVLAASTPATMFNMYLTGQADWVTEVPNRVIPDLLAQRRPDFVPSPLLGVYFYRLNVTRPPLNDRKVRQALSLAIDRREIIETITRAGEVPARHFVPPGIDGYTSPQSSVFDPERARKLLAEAGYPGGRGFPKFDILYNSHDTHRSVAELIQSQWKRTLGIDVGLRNQEWAVYLASQQQLSYAACRAAWIGDYNDPNTFLDLFVGDGPNNQTGWRNAEYDRRIEAAARELDPARRAALFKEAEAILLDEAPIIPIYFYVSKDIVRPYVRGYYPNVQDVHPLKNIWIDREAKAELLAKGGGP